MPAKSNSTPAERLKIVIENAGMSTYALSRHIGFQRPENLYQILRGKCGISKNMANIIHQKFPRYSIDWLIYGDNDSQETLHDNIVRIPLYNNYETMLFPPVLPADEILIFSSTLAANAQIAITYADERFNPDSRKSVLLLRKKAVAEEICYGNMYFIVADHLRLVRRSYKVTTKKRNAERYSDRIELQGFQSCFRLFVKPSQSPLKPNQDAATLLVRNHARNGDKRTRITKQGVKD